MGVASSRHGESTEIQLQTLKGPLCRSTCKYEDDITLETGLLCALHSYGSQYGQINGIGNAVMNVQVS